MTDTIKDVVERLRDVEKDFGGLRPSIVVLTSDAADLLEELEVALTRARDEALEEAAKVSERVWFDARDTEWDEGVNSAKRAIATAIRSLKQKGA